MISFANDYSEGACPQILEALGKENLLQNPGYGLDAHCEAAADMIRTLCAAPNADVHFLVGGTQVNFISIAAFLRPHQAAIAADCGHIATHETGSVEATGHKICTVPGANGKLTPELVRQVVAGHPNEHMVQPKLVFLSSPSEFGTIYTKAELTEMRKVCDELGLYLYLDGARLAAGLTCSACDVTLADIAAVADAFYIGGTKNGLLMGEALVILNDALKADFRYLEKQRGAMLAKGFLLGIQFETVLKDGLYFALAKNANDRADELRRGFAALGVPMLVDSPTNQLFPVLPKTVTAKLAEHYVFEQWEDVDSEREAVRFVCSWATPAENTAALLADLNTLMGA
ncbi:MAG: aminotransferase class I/II-fold pyridoxal phosphate-dependent enzyme [Pygmaiobacter massiliensis]|nr:aminotransferase class I/II-fold pyridoxal phosphate-dependent enzyme [Pygmaiobacter massiliensis]